jgi:hypothetical protein
VSALEFTSGGRTPGCHLRPALSLGLVASFAAGRGALFGCDRNGENAGESEDADHMGMIGSASHKLYGRVQILRRVEAAIRLPADSA